MLLPFLTRVSQRSMKSRLLSVLQKDDCTAHHVNRLPMGVEIKISFSVQDHPGSCRIIQDHPGCTTFDIFARKMSDPKQKLWCNRNKENSRNRLHVGSIHVFLDTWVRFIGIMHRLFLDTCELGLSTSRHKCSLLPSAINNLPWRLHCMPT